MLTKSDFQLEFIFKNYKVKDKFNNMLSHIELAEFGMNRGTNLWDTVITADLANFLTVIFCMFHIVLT